MFQGVNKKKLLTVLAVLLVLGLLCAIFKSQMGSRSYSVVYLSTGDVYVGKLSTFPSLTLTDSYQLQVIKDTTDPAKSSFQLNPTKELVWATEKIHLTRKSLVFYAQLSPEGPIAKKLAEQAK